MSGIDDWDDDAGGDAAAADKYLSKRKQAPRPADFSKQQERFPVDIVEEDDEK